MNIGVLTLYKNSSNFGGLLQAYALVKVLEKNGYNAEQILLGEYRKDYKNRTFIDKIKEHGLKYAVELAKNKIDDKMIRSEISQGDLNSTLERCKEFRDEIPHTKVVNEEDLSGLNSYFDAFIVGSDQVWNSKWLRDVYLLSFARKLKMAYAASIARFDFSRFELQQLTHGLEDFKWISVRESQAVTFLRERCNIKSDLVLDPTMLLTIDEWSCVEKKPQELGDVDDFIFCYFLKGNNYKRKVASRFSKESGVPTVFPNFTGNKIKYDDPSRNERFLYNIGPCEFLWLIHHSKMVLTDSFHGTALSIVFNKQFYHILRSSNGSGDMNSRIYSLLSMFNLEKQIFSENAVESIIDYSIVNRTLCDMQKYSLELLLSNLQSINETQCE